MVGTEFVVELKPNQNDKNHKEGKAVRYDVIIGGAVIASIHCDDIAGTDDELNRRMYNKPGTYRFNCIEIETLETQEKE